jgi:hypothetical protein
MSNRDKSHLIKFLFFHHQHLNHEIIHSLLQNKSRHEVDTIKKTRFHHAIENRTSNAIIKNVCKAKNLSQDTEKL